MKTAARRGTPAAAVLAHGITRHGQHCGCRYCEPPAPSTSDHATSQGVDTIPLESARGGAVVLSIPPPNTCTLVSARCVMGQCEHPGRTVRR